MTTWLHPMAMNIFTSEPADQSQRYRMVGVAAVLVAAMAVGVMLAVNASNRHQPAGGLPVALTTSTAAQSPAQGALPAPSVVATSTLDQASFVCGSSTLVAKQSPVTAFVDAIRTAPHAGYDRLTLEFKNGRPTGVTIRPQAGTMFTQSPSGRPVTLAGNDGILVLITGADAHTAYVGLRDVKARYAGLVEVRVLEDFEGHVTLGIGVIQTSCYRVTILSNPVRLVIDVRNG